MMGHDITPSPRGAKQAPPVALDERKGSNEHEPQQDAAA